MSMENQENIPEIEKVPTPAPPINKQKPVFFYILVLFSVAFALILMSFFMHQRSNQEVLGELHNNVNALEQLQEALDENLRLEKELSTLEETHAAQLEALQTELEQLKTEASLSADALSGMNALYLLQQTYAAKDYEACGELIAQLEKDGTDKLIPAAPILETISPPHTRYLLIKEAVEVKLAQSTAK